LAPDHYLAGWCPGLARSLRFELEKWVDTSAITTSRFDDDIDKYKC
jgi:hypothetical protein